MKRLAVKRLKAHFGLSISRACGVVELNRSSYHYKAVKKDTEAIIIRRMKELIAAHQSWGYPIIHDVLRYEELVKNYKRT